MKTNHNFGIPVLNPTEHDIGTPQESTSLSLVLHLKIAKGENLRFSRANQVQV